MLLAASMPLNAVSVMAAENAGEESTETVAVPEEDNIEVEEATEAAVVSEDKNTEEAEMAGAFIVPMEESVEEENIEGAVLEDDIEMVETAAEGQTTDTSEVYGGESLPEMVIDDPIPEVIYENVFALPASAKVTAKNVAQGIKLSWEPVSGAAEYVVYRGNTKIKRTTKTEITDGDVKNDNGKKFTYKVAAVSKTGRISIETRSSTYYRLLPVGVTALKSTVAGKMTVTYGKNEKGSGYVVRFGLKSDLSDAKVITVTDPTITSKTFSGLTEGKTYYVQVRSYKIENGVRYYSGYCTTKSVTIARTESASSVKITFNGSQTIAVGTTRRLYVSGAGGRTVTVTMPKSSTSVKVTKDSTSYIVTGNKAGSTYVTVTVGSVKKRFDITVLSDNQIAQRVYQKVKKECPECILWGSEREGKNLVVSMHLKSMGEGAIASDIKVNLQTGRAVIDLDQDFMDEWDLTIPKSFLIW